MKETITIAQDIVIGYDCEEGRIKAIEAVKKDTNWMAFSEGYLSGESVKYEACKTGNIRVISTKANPLIKKPNKNLNNE